MNFGESDNVCTGKARQFGGEFFVASSPGLEIEHGATIKTSSNH